MKRKSKQSYFATHKTDVTFKFQRPSVKFCWHSATFVHLCKIGSCSHTTRAELSGCNTDYWPTKPQLSNLWPLTEKVCQPRSPEDFPPSTLEHTCLVASQPEILLSENLKVMPQNVDVPGERTNRCEMKSQENTTATVCCEWLSKEAPAETR